MAFSVAEWQRMMECLGSAVVQHRHSSVRAALSTSWGACLTHGVSDATGQRSTSAGVELLQLMPTTTEFFKARLVSCLQMLTCSFHTDDDQVWTALAASTMP